MVCEGRIKPLTDEYITTTLHNPFGCRNLVLASPNIGLGETVVCAMEIIVERGGSIGLSWLVQLTLNIGLCP